MPIEWYFLYRFSNQSIKIDIYFLKISICYIKINFKIWNDYFFPLQFFEQNIHKIFFDRILFII